MSVSRWRSQYRAYLRSTAAEECQLSFSAFMLKKKADHLRKHSGGTKRCRASARRLARRSSSRIQRIIWNGSGQRRKVITEVSLLTFRSRPDALRDTLCPNYEKEWRSLPSRLRDRTVTHIAVTDFSLARNPAGVLQKIQEIVLACARHPDVRLNFLDSEVDDVAPYILLSHTLRALPPVILGGRIRMEVGRVLEAVGLNRALGIGRFSGKRHTKDILPFKMVQRVTPSRFKDPKRQLRPQRKEHVADQFCETLSNWLILHNLALTEEAEANITSSIGEALDNAERHGLISEEASKGDWTMAGFSRLSLDEDENVVVHCSVSMVNIGETISSSLKTASEDVAGRVDAYVQTHSRGGATPWRWSDCAP